MTIRTSAFRGLAILSLTALGLAACEGKDTINIPEPPPPAVEVTVAPTQVSLAVGQTATAAAVVKNSTNQSVTWSSGNNAVATVSAAGVITAVAPGSTVITATSAADATAKGLIAVTVTPPTITLSLLPTTATINSVAPGNTVQLAATVSGSTNQAVTCTSSATGVATVAGTLVTAVAPGIAVITCAAAADANVKTSAVITVVAPTSNVAITLVPATVTTVVGGTVQLQANVTGSTNTAVTFRTSDATVATVGATTGLVTGVKQGTAIITAIAAADTTKKATAVVTVQGASVAIAVVPTGTQTGPGPFIIQTNVAIPGGSADSLMIRLINASDTTKVYTWRCQTFTAAGAATQVFCPIDPADFDPYTAGVQILPNGTYILRAILMKANVIADFAQWGTNVVTNYSNTVRGVISWDNTLVDTDNAADDPMATNAGNVWFGGSATVSLSASIFTGATLASATLGVDTGCDGTAEATRTVTFTNGLATMTWSEANNLGATTPGIDDVESATVCFIIAPTGLDAGSIAVPLVTGLGNVTVAVAGTNTTLGADQNQFRVDNKEPAAGAAALVFDATDFDGNDGTTGLEVFLGTSSSVVADGTNPTVLNAAGADGGVGGLTYIYYAVPAASYDGTSQSTLRTSAAAGTAFTSPTALAETQNDTDYVLVVETRDALGNRRFAGGPRFGVDVTAPTIAVDATNSPANNSVNPADNTIRFAVTDAISGSEGLVGSVKGHSVFQYDADSGVEVQCYNFDGTFYRVESGLAGGGTCTARRVSTSVFASGGTEYYEVTVPAFENFYEISVQSIDAANNTSTATITYNALRDVTAGPAAGMGTAVTVNNYTIDNVAGTATVNGVLKDNIEIRDYDSRFRFAGLMAGAINVPDEVPFSAPVMVGTYGLPLTAEVTVSATSGSIVDGIVDDITQGTPADWVPSQFGFGMQDLASNYTFGFIGFTGGAFDGFPASFTCAAIVGPPAYDACGMVYTTADATIDRTPPSGGTPPLSTTMTATITTQVGAADPLKTVYFYYVDPGFDLIYNGDATEHNVLVAAVPAPTAPTVTSEQRRIFTATTTLTATNLPPNVAGFQFQTFAIGVAADGDGIITPVVLVAVDN